MSKADDQIAADIERQVHLYPERYPHSLGGLIPDEEYYAQQDQLLDQELPDESGHPEFKKERDTDEGAPELTTVAVASLLAPDDSVDTFDLEF